MEIDIEFAAILAPRDTKIFYRNIMQALKIIYKEKLQLENNILQDGDDMELQIMFELLQDLEGRGAKSIGNTIIVVKPEELNVKKTEKDPPQLVFIHHQSGIGDECFCIMQEIIFNLIQKNMGEKLLFLVAR